MKRCQLHSCNNVLTGKRRKFCCNRHKDRYHNINNARGRFAQLGNSFDLDDPQDSFDAYLDSVHPFSTEALGQWED